MYWLSIRFGYFTVSVSGRDNKENEKQATEGQEPGSSKLVVERPSKTLQRRPKPTGAGRLLVSNVPAEDPRE